MQRKIDKPLQSAIYEGTVRHRRYYPHAHAFSYKMFFMFLDLAELDRVFQRRWFWSVKRFNLARFKRADYLGDPNKPLDQCVRELVREKTGHILVGPIRMLAHLRYFGHCFNPVTFYYCYQKDGVSLECVVAEITNTPWQERHAYVLPISFAQKHQSAFVWEFEKRFHVSPFIGMDRQYDWHLQAPSEDLRVHMNVSKQGEKEFDATLVMQRKPISPRNLAACLLRYPLLTIKVVLAIHWQALLIWRRHNPVYDHPTKQKG